MATEMLIFNAAAYADIIEWAGSEGSIIRPRLLANGTEWADSPALINDPDHAGKASVLNALPRRMIHAVAGPGLTSAEYWQPTGGGPFS